MNNILNKVNDAQLKRLERDAKIELARRNFYEFCKLLDPKFYKTEKERPHLKTLCDELQDFINVPVFDEFGNIVKDNTKEHDDILVINVPPRHGKTYTISFLDLWLYGKFPQLKIINASYAEDVAQSFSRTVRDAILTEPSEDINARIVYRDIFPHIEMKQDNKSVSQWALNNAYQSFLATSPGGKSTGFGGDLIIIDDLIKNNEEALNKRALQSKVDWFQQTMLSRLERNVIGQIIIVMTRWAKDDLAGVILDKYENLGFKIKSIKMKAYDEVENKMLCDEIFNKQDYNRTLKTETAVCLANYQQEPIDVQGTLFKEIKEVRDLSDNVRKKWCVIDPAFKGEDYFTAIFFNELEDETAEVFDIIYTQDNVDKTIPLLVAKLAAHDIHEVVYEENGGGQLLGDLIKEKLIKHCKVTGYSQSSKMSKANRIYSYSTIVQEYISFHYKIQQDHTEFYQDVIKYQAKGRNLHDDSVDCLTAVAQVLRGDIKGIGFRSVSPMENLNQMRDFFGR